MTETQQVLSYGDTSRKEDVLPLVEILTSKENYFINNLGSSVATDTVHSVLTDTLRTAASAAVVEEGDYTQLARTTPSRVTNYVQIVAIPFQVSRTQQEIQKWTGENELARQTTKALIDWSNAAEFDLVRQTGASGASGTTPKMLGLLQAISQAETYSAQTSGTAFSSTILSAMMKDSWSNSNGEVATDIFLGGYLRNVMDQFTYKSNVVIANGDVTKINNAVSIYETSFGVLNVHSHRYLQQSSDATGRILLVRPDKLKIAWLKKPYIDTGLARSGDYDRRAVVGKFTLEVRNKYNHVYHDGFNIG